MDHQEVYVKQLWSDAATKSDANAFGQLFELYFPKLLIFALKYTRERCQAEDVVQQVFLKCWEKRNSLTAVDNIEAYLYKSIKNEVTDLLRRQVLHSKYQQQTAAQQQNLEQPRALPNHELKLRLGREEILSAAINDLSPQQKRVYQLSKERGWSYARIAQEMEVSTHTVKWHASAALQSLSHFLKNHENDLFVLIFGLFLFF
ncbi:RNA polymerase sigma-70 factor, ECF subfamily [Arachidicoccus rhizosphaerae]|uniref:RNA polymerase sigma-70 factor, ECF subfamily n=1 Tax=Arachidicoccus rhizosphaerae TaxID=551991 RepID=A0A1H4BLF5_9BACT|nr:RNA polymerase sigma-70 factor [Arachidicoccus rhizosphaerae]SEA48884.1 RNA polymerase sigma-70 factor, ECF subfamily [Arachidicoccus rhizosphaerae]